MFISSLVGSVMSGVRKWLRIFRDLISIPRSIRIFLMASCTNYFLKYGLGALRYGRLARINSFIPRSS